MRWQLPTVVIIGLVGAAVVLADEDFGEDDMGEYDESAVEEFYQVGQPEETVVFGAPKKVVQPKETVAGVGELPFAVLAPELDGDGDGLGDADEVRLATQKDNPDTDGDGYIDGLEVVRGYNPLKASPGDKVVFTVVDMPSPSNQYQVTGVRLEDKAGQKVLVVTGVGPANSLVTLLVFSEEPKVWVTRADDTGRFRYVTENTLAVGQHRVFAAGTAAGGTVLAASAPLNFVRGMDTLELLESTLASAAGETAAAPQPVVVDDESRMWLNVAAGGGVLAAALLAGGGYLLWRRRKRGGEDTSGTLVDR